MQKLFGTDGMRGEAGRFPLDALTVGTIGRSLARQLVARSAGEGRAPRIVMGRDTRESGEWIERAFVEGARGGGRASANWRASSRRRAWLISRARFQRTRASSSARRTIPITTTASRFSPHGAQTRRRDRAANRSRHPRSARPKARRCVRRRMRD